MRKICVLLCIILCMGLLTGCDQVMQQAESIVGQIDVETVITEVVENIDWEELKSEAAAGYDALTQQYPALKGENIKTYLKDNGLELLNSYISSADEAMQENARKLGEIIKILCPELTDEIDSVIAG